MRIRDIFFKSKNLRINKHGEIVKIDPKKPAYCETYPVPDFRVAKYHWWKQSKKQTVSRTKLLRYLKAEVKKLRR